jgi:hypothetical protein
MIITENRRAFRGRSGERHGLGTLLPDNASVGKLNEFLFYLSLIDF